MMPLLRWFEEVVRGFAFEGGTGGRSSRENLADSILGPGGRNTDRWNQQERGSRSLEGVEQEQSGKAAEHEPRHAQMNEGFGGLLLALVVLRQTPLAIEPTEGALDNPALGLDDEALVFV